MSVERPPQLEGGVGRLGGAPKLPSHAFFTRSGKHLPAGLAAQALSPKPLVCLVTDESGRVAGHSVASGMLPR